MYVGKAKNLKKRIAQYANLQDERPQIGKLVNTAATLKFEVLESELMALLVEAELIKKYQPAFNILLKDDKSNLYICITRDKFPRILMLRRPEILRFGQNYTSFGPFPSGYKVKQVLQIARHIFKWCDHPGDLIRPCFYTHIGLCSGACTGEVEAEAYKDMIAHLKDFLRGHTSKLLKELKTELDDKVGSEKFEEAAILRDQINVITQVLSPSYRLAPDLTLPVLTANRQQEALLSLRSILRDYLPLPATFEIERIEGYDISNIQGTSPTASMVVAMNGKMDHNEYRHFGIKSLSTPNDFAMMEETLTRRQSHPEWGIPSIVLLDGGKGQLRRVLSIWQWPSVVVSIAKEPDRLIIPIVTPPDDKHKNSKTKITYQEVELNDDIPATRLLQTIRDESHRFSRRLHHIKRDKSMFE